MKSLCGALNRKSLEWGLTVYILHVVEQLFTSWPCLSGNGNANGGGIHPRSHSLKKGTAALSRNAVSVLTLESPNCLTYWQPILGRGRSGSDRSLGLGESSLCWNREGEEDIKANFSFSISQGVCAEVANVCQHQGIPPSWESRSLSKLDGKDVSPSMSTQLWRCSISDMYPYPPTNPQNNNEVFFVLTT